MDVEMNGTTMLRCITYLCPDQPVEYFELLLRYLEKKLNCVYELVYESRWPGPSLDRLSSFTNRSFDIVFMDTYSYLSLNKKDSNIELLPISSVHYHKKGEDRPGIFSDVIAHIDLKSRVKEFIDLRGSKWAYSRPQSICGNLTTVQNLKEMGENPTFFGTTLRSGSCTKSIEMVLNKTADATSVDSNALQNYLKRNPFSADQLFVVCSWGMLSPYPIIVNKNMDDNLKTSIVEALSTMHGDPEFGPLLSSYNVRKYAEISSNAYRSALATIEATKSTYINSTVYY